MTNEPLIDQRIDNLAAALRALDTGVEIELANGVRVKRENDFEYCVRSHFDPTPNWCAPNGTYRTAHVGNSFAYLPADWNNGEAGRPRDGSRRAAFKALVGNAHTNDWDDMGVRARQALRVDVTAGA